MGTNKISRLKFINTLKGKNISFFNLVDLKKIFDIRNDNTLKHLIRRLKEASIIKRLTKNKYLFLHSSSLPSDFALANFLTIPSYISLESALSYYSLIDQFPYRITSITLSKPKEVKTESKLFTYSKIKKEYFRDFVKIDDFLIATKEKAIFDYLYFIYKGLRPKNIIKDLSAHLENKTVNLYLKTNSDKRFINFLKNYVKL